MLDRSARHEELWEVALDAPHVDAGRLLRAIEETALAGPQDFRTRLLMRDSLSALRHVKGKDRIAQWVANSPARSELEAIQSEDLGKAGFPSLMERVMDTTGRETILQFLREVGSHIDAPARIAIGGSSALIFSMGLVRKTEDIDVVDELPAEIRDQHQLLSTLSTRFGLQLTHFQSHYLPAGWDTRLRSIGKFGKLDAFVVDELDVLVSKLTSKRERDRDDLRVLAPKIDKAALADRLRTAGGALLGESDLRENATLNWYIVYGEPLPA